MGRGRQKAKHTKVARELKYFSPEVDITALERELVHPDENELIDKWADLFPDTSDKAASGDNDAVSENDNDASAAADADADAGAKESSETGHSGHDKS
jgi:hypothetical protein